MRRMTAACVSLLGLLVASTGALASEARGIYLETRTNQVYTGPCFANAETGLTGRNAIMAWHIDEGTQDGVDLTDLNVVVVIGASDTLAFHGLDDAAEMRSVVLVDDRATDSQREALISFAKQHAGKAFQDVVRVTALPISMDLDMGTLKGVLSAGKEVRLETRKARATDCVCSHESEKGYYPPLVQVENSVAGIATVGEFKGRGLGARWSTPENRSAYMATFVYE